MNATTLTKYTAFGVAILLSACMSFEEDVQPAFDALNGKTVSQASQIMGPPVAKQKTERGMSYTWQYTYSYTSRQPIQYYMNGKWVTSGYRNINEYSECSYTALASQGKIISGKVTGGLTACKMLSQGSAR